MSRTFSRYYGKNASKDYAGTVARRKNRAVKQVLRSARITDVQNYDDEKFEAFSGTERTAVYSAPSEYED